MSLKVSMILELVNKLSGPARKAQADVAKLAGKAGLGGVAAPAKAASAGIDRVSGVANRAKAKIASLTTGAKALADRGFKAIGKGAELAAYGVGMLIGKLIRFSAQAAAAGLAGAALTAVYAGGVFLGGIIRVASSVEQLEIELTRLTGSAEKAKAELNWARGQKLAVPMEELLQAYVAARKAGLSPMTNELRSMVDMAISAKKPVLDVANALADAKRGDFGGLDGLGIKAEQSKKAGLAFTYLDKTGKRVTRTARSNAAAIQKALVGIFDDRAKGAADDFADTFQGTWLQLQNWIAGFELDIANKGFFKSLKGALQRVTSWIDAASKDGRLEAWAKTISDWLSTMLDRAIQFIETTDWNKVVSDLKSVASAAVTVANAIGEVVKLSSQLGSLSSPDMTVKPGQQRSWWQWYKSIDPGQPDPMKRGVGQFLSPQTRERLRPAGAGWAAPKTSSLQLDNHLRIEIATPPGVQARATPGKLAANTTMTTSRDVYRGQAMSAAA